MQASAIVLQTFGHKNAFLTAMELLEAKIKLTEAEEDQHLHLPTVASIAEEKPIFFKDYFKP